MIEQTVSIERMEEAIDIFGSFDENIRLLEKELGIRVACPAGERPSPSRSFATSSSW